MTPDTKKKKPAEAPEKDTHSTGQALTTGLRLLKEALPKHRKLFALSIVCTAGVAGFTAALAYSTRLIVNDVFVDANLGAATRIAIVLLFVSIGKSFFRYLNEIIAVKFNRTISAQFQKRLFRKILFKDVGHFASKHAAKQMSQVKGLGQACGKTVTNIAVGRLTDTLTLFALLIVMLIQDPLMTLFSGLMIPVIFVMVGVLSKRVRAAANAETELTGAYFAVGSEAFEGIKTVKSYNLEKKSIAKFEEAVEKLEKRLFGIAKISAATAPLMELLGGIVIALFVLYAASQTITHGKTPGEFTAFIIAFLMAYKPAERLSRTWVELQKTLVQVGRMYTIIDAPSKELDAGIKTLTDAETSIQFEDVSFAYSERQPALHHVNFEIKAEERIAVVGGSGAGKSTLVDLLLRFYDPDAGSIRIGGTDLRDVANLSLKQNIALISQDVFLFEGTIRDNIRDGNLEATDAEIELAARRSQLSYFLDEMPLGLETFVGLNGRSLSGGQKQRVGIARALAKNAMIYIFDESTSALDIENERRIMDMIASEMKNATVIFVTHRFSTLNYVDRVLVLDQGSVVAFETPSRLEKGNARFRTLFGLELPRE